MCHFIVGFHVLCVDLGFHVVIGVGRLTVQQESFIRQLHFTTHTQFQVQSSFLLDVAVRLCRVIVNSICIPNSCIFHIAKTRLLRCCLYRQISQFRSSRKWVQTLCLPKSSLRVDVGSKDSSWEELACESLCSGTLSSTRFSLNSCSHSRMWEHNGSPSSIVVSSLFGFGFLVGLGNNGSHRFIISS